MVCGRSHALVITQTGIAMENRRQVHIALGVTKLFVQTWFSLLYTRVKRQLTS